MQKALVLLWATLLGSSLYGQTGLLNKAKDLTKKEDKKEVKKDAPVKSEPEKRATPDKPVRNRPSDTDASASKPAGNTAAKEQPQVPDMSSAVLSPSVAWKSLLDDACFQYNPVTGYFRPVAFFIYFLPERDMAGKPMNYNNYASHILPYIRLEVVNKSKGQTEGKFYYRAEPYALPEYRLKLYENALNPDIPAYLTLTEGEYSLDFFIGETKITTHPIRVEKQSNPDPYSPVKHMLWMRGEWENWAAIRFNADGDLTFLHYQPERHINIKSQSAWDEEYIYPSQVKMYRNGTMVAFYNIEDYKMTRGKSVGFNGKWYQNTSLMYRWPVIEPSSSSREDRLDFQRKHLTDGDYTIDLEIFKPEGTVKEKYKFSVKGGAIVSDTHADRSKHSDPLTLVEQGVDMWYLRKQ